MSNSTADLLQAIRQLEERVEAQIAARSEALGYELEKKRVIFEKEVRERHRKLKMGSIRFLRTSPLLTILSAPVVYSLIIPLALLDVSIIVYQWICFSIWNIKRAKRSDYVVIDRHYLPYLNGIEKINCIYCGYGNGVIAFAREVSSRTEQYWCPIKHARRARGQHERVHDFVDFGDSENWRERLEELRRKLK